jgi:hypothetical protein
MWAPVLRLVSYVFPSARLSGISISSLVQPQKDWNQSQRSTSVYSILMSVWSTLRSRSRLGSSNQFWWIHLHPPTPPSTTTAQRMTERGEKNNLGDGKSVTIFIQTMFSSSLARLSGSLEIPSRSLSQQRKAETLCAHRQRRENEWMRIGKAKYETSEMFYSWLSMCNDDGDS